MWMVCRRQREALIYVSSKLVDVGGLGGVGVEGALKRGDAFFTVCVCVFFFYS